MKIEEYSDIKEASIILAQKVNAIVKTNEKSKILFQASEKLTDFYFFLTHLAYEEFVDFDKVRFYSNLELDNIDESSTESFYHFLNEKFISKTLLEDIHFPDENNFSEILNHDKVIDVAVLVLNQNGSFTYSSQNLDNKICIKDKATTQNTELLLQNQKENITNNTSIWSMPISTLLKVKKLYIFAIDNFALELIEKAKSYSEFDPDFQLSIISQLDDVEFSILKSK
ncbi:6-phosphogluconolactonase/glucosamine-6-phosphate isomerase/deaminase [Mycoplasma testudineum]|uniref:6-phosphogluconolactonase/glucosamine-6-phosphate isomerase/deaminase n=1 Tax=Mycoplasma testudineum TaxID=244584 RepID=A0A4R6IF54_9MOLU|nr:hypothetical protein [Mycoplasma testudineum]OYD26817.1 hypothetical protein CG473_01760 [Mycoplasma testudineum]TDO20351.1 6-phosphogluconolactonase/glucosamine-6-phosphate isomerase/deaminase [Mycoplasma testudineum]